MIKVTSTVVISPTNTQHTDAYDLVLRSTLFTNRCPAAEGGSWHSNSSTRPDYLNFVALSDSYMRPYFNYLIEQFPNINAVSVLDIQLDSGEVLDEVVVIGYGTVKKEDVSGSVQSVS